MKIYFQSLCFCLLFLFVSHACFGQKIKYNMDSKRIMPFPREISGFLETKKLNLTIGISVVKLNREKNMGGFYRIIQMIK